METTSGTRSNSSIEQRSKFPPKIIFNTDGCRVFQYLKRRNVDDVTEILVHLAETNVDVVSVLIGINDDLSWRGSPHGELWGDNMGDSFHKLFLDADSNTKSTAALGMGPSDLLQMNLRALVDDGYDVMQLYLDRAKQVGLSIYASIRMNDAHCNMEHRMSDARRSAMKVRRPDLLIGSDVSNTMDSWSSQFNFSWQWDYANTEVRDRFLGLIDETLTRYDVEGIELDFCRTPPFFKPHQGLKNVPTMSNFVSEAKKIVLKYASQRGKDIKLACRFTPSIDAMMELGIEIETWISEGVIDIAIMSSSGAWSPETDVPRAVKAAEKSGALVYVGSGGTPDVSPQDGYQWNNYSVLRAIALNSYKQGAAGIHLFNHDYASNRPLPVMVGDESPMPVIKHHPAYDGMTGNLDMDRFTKSELQALGDLGGPQALENLNRCYCLATKEYPGDFPCRVPRKLALTGRGAGPEHAMHFNIEDDIKDGLGTGRIKRTELRLCLTDYEQSFDRICCSVNGQTVDLMSARKIRWIEDEHRAMFTELNKNEERSGRSIIADTSTEEEWLVVDNPPICHGDNTVLVVLEGFQAPKGTYLSGRGPAGPWPTLHQCELLVICQEQ